MTEDLCRQEAQYFFYICNRFVVVNKSSILVICHRVFILTDSCQFRCANGDCSVALGSSMCLALLVWVGGGLLKWILYYFGNEPSLGQKSPILHLPPAIRGEKISP